MVLASWPAPSGVRCLPLPGAVPTTLSPSPEATPHSRAGSLSGALHMRPRAQTCCAVCEVPLHCRRGRQPRWQLTSPSRNSSTLAGCSWCTGGAATRGPRHSASSSCTGASSSPPCRCVGAPRGLERYGVSGGPVSNYCPFLSPRLCSPPSATSRLSPCTRGSSWWGKW